MALEEIALAAALIAWFFVVALAGELGGLFSSLVASWVGVWLVSLLPE